MEKEDSQHASDDDPCERYHEESHKTFQNWPVEDLVGSTAENFPARATNVVLMPRDVHVEEWVRVPPLLEVPSFLILCRAVLQ